MLTLQQVYDRFPTDRSCQHCLNQSLWPKGIFCAHCNQTLIHWYPSKNCFYCNHCRRYFRPRQTTLFHRTRIPLQKWFWLIAVYHHSKNSKRALSTRKIAELLELNKNTVLRMFRCFRRVEAEWVQSFADEICRNVK